MYNSFFNISTSNSNSSWVVTVYARFHTNPLTGVSLGGSPVNSWEFTITIPDGYYSAEAISAYLHYYFYLYKIYTVHPTSGELRYPLSVSANSTQYAIQLSFTTIEATSTGYTLPSDCPFQYFVAEASPQCPSLVVTSGIGSLLGYTPATYGGQSTDTSILSDLTPAISITTSVNFHCNLVNNNLNIPSSYLSSLPLTEGFGSLVVFNASSNLAQSRIVNGHFSSIEVWFTDSQTDQILTPKDLDLTVVLAISEGEEKQGANQPQRVIR